MPMTNYEAEVVGDNKTLLGKLRNMAVNQSTNGYYYWLGVITLAALYNSIFFLARATFDELQDNNVLLWAVLDYVCDFLYIVDMLVQLRTGYLEQGLLVKEPKKLAIHYVKHGPFTMDVVSLLPTDLLYFATGIKPIFRVNRSLRLHRALEFTERTEARTSWPNAFRILYLVFLIAITIHWNGCFYFAISWYYGFGTDEWVYDNNTDYESLGRQYIYSFFWSTLTLTTIGETPSPERDLQFLFVTVDFLVGVLIFATIVGNVGTMIANMNAARTEFQTRMDAIKQYMEFRKVSKDLEQRVINWFDYIWSENQSLDEDSVLHMLPNNLQTEIAIHVHFETLRKVRIFQDCEAGLLAELVLKLKLQVFSPGDFICRKGDIGREMFIVKRGKLNVVSEDLKKVFVTLGEGAVFGELSILNIAGNKGGNRRSANVQSVGYSDLFALSKDDLWDALKEYPEAKQMLMSKGREILRKDNLLDESVPENSETAEEKAERLEGVSETLLVRLARLLAEQTNQTRKLRARLQTLEKDLGLSAPDTEKDKQTTETNNT